MKIGSVIQTFHERNVSALVLKLGDLKPFSHIDRNLLITAAPFNSFLFNNFTNTFHILYQSESPWSRAIITKFGYLNIYTLAVQRKYKDNMKDTYSVVMLSSRAGQFGWSWYGDSRNNGSAASTACIALFWISLFWWNINGITSWNQNFSWLGDKEFSGVTSVTRVTSAIRPSNLKG